MSETNLLQVENLTLHFPISTDLLGRTTVKLKAVDDISFSLSAGKTLGIVGESGSGKTTLGRCIARLYQPTSGSIKFNSGSSTIDLARLTRKQLRPIRAQIQMLFQDPNASLNARMRVGDIVAEPLEIHQVGNRASRAKIVSDLLLRVGLGVDAVNRFPHQLSGGQRQRVGIARALSIKPKLLICDEPVSALDVSVQAQVLNLLIDLQKELGLTYIFIAHDLGVVDYICERIMVMYLGRIVEQADRSELVSRPAHPYTAALLRALPVRSAFGARKRTVLHGDIPSPINPPSGCVFRTRCTHAKDICAANVPLLLPLKRHPDTQVACHLANELDLKSSGIG